MYSADVMIEPKLSDNALSVLQKRYLRGETPKEMFLRVAKAAAEVSLNYDRITQFYNLMASLDFLPNSPTLMNAGRELGQLAACFVVPVEDSMEGIFQAIKDMAIIQKTGGGTGFSFSRLRPKGDPVSSTVGEASGPVSFMKVFNSATEAVKQGGARRGANMGILRVDHPDILEFINIKQDLKELTNFNLSVGITNEFIECLEKNKPFMLKFKNTPYVKVDPRLIWNSIVDCAWKTGEPGVIFLDTLNEDNPLPILGEIEATNPCIVGDTLIKTVEGMIPIKDLVGQEIDVYCVNDKYQLTIRRAKNIRMTKQNATLVKVITTKGEVICTPDHKFYTRNRGYIEAQHLRSTDKLVALNVAPKNQKYTKVYLTGTGAGVPSEHIFIAQHYYGDLTGRDVHHKDGNPKNNFYSNLEVLNHGDHSIVSNKGHINWAEHDPLTGRWLPKVKQNRDWTNKLGVHPIGVNMKLLRVEKLNYTEDVYDLEVEEFHNFFANYVLIHNCGEQPLLPYEACNLGSINLANMIEVDPYDFTYSVDYDRLKACVHLAVEFLDNIIDINKYPLPIIEQKVKANRKIGLGVMGWADMLFKLQISYDDEKALQLASSIMHFIQQEARKVSTYLAEQRGPFPNWEFSAASAEGCKPRRNATTTTIAPTGTLSIIANVSSGIEPCYLLSYKKELADGGVLYFINDTVKKYWQQFCAGPLNDALMHEIIQEVKYIDKDPNSALNTIFKEAHEIAPLDHVNMQAAFQRYTDNAVSKTINFKNEVTKEEIEKVFLAAFHLGCKGITIYRDGSRDTQPMSSNKQKESKPIKEETILIEASSLPSNRPTILEGLTEQVPTGCGKLLITVNHYASKIYEVLLRTGNLGGCAGYADGVARLISIALRYGVPVEEIIDQLNSVRCDNFRYQTGKNPKLKGKSCPDVVGTTLKQMQQLIQQIIKVEVDIPLKEIHTAQNCLECGSPIENAEGCIKCIVCGFSRC